MAGGAPLGERKEIKKKLKDLIAIEIPQEDVELVKSSGSVL